MPKKDDDDLYGESCRRNMELIAPDNCHKGGVSRPRWTMDTHIVTNPVPPTSEFARRESGRISESFWRERAYPRLGLHLDVNYDACHFAIQFEEAKESLTAFRGKISALAKSI